MRNDYNVGSKHNTHFPDGLNLHSSGQYSKYEQRSLNVCILLFLDTIKLPLTTTI